MKHRILLFLQILFLGALVACQGQQPDNNDDTDTLSGNISLITNHDIIRANGSDTATLTVLLTDESGMIHDVSNDAEIYSTTSDTPLATNQFATSQEGSHSFYALYGLAVSNTIDITAVGGLSDIPADPNASSTDFTHRIMLLQHTGTECPNCPGLMNNLKRVAEDEAYAGRYYHVASHSYNDSDPAYSSSAANLSGSLGVRSYPWLTFNFFRANAYLGETESIKECIDLFHEERAAVGIAASTTIVDGKIYANVGVKAGKSGTYRLGMWVLEDNIHGTQSGANASWQHNHNNCLRGMGGANKNEKLYGKNLGLIESGQSSSAIVAVELDKDWKVDNCKLFLFVASENNEGEIELINSTLCPAGEMVEYAYN